MMPCRNCVSWFPVAHSPVFLSKTCLSSHTLTPAHPHTHTQIGVFFDLKKLLEDSKAAVPPELARHEASKVKPGTVEAKSRKDQTVFAT